MTILLYCCDHILVKYESNTTKNSFQYCNHSLLLLGGICTYLYITIGLLFHRGAPTSAQARERFREASRLAKSSQRLGRRLSPLSTLLRKCSTRASVKGDHLSSLPSQHASKVKLSAKQLSSPPCKQQKSCLTETAKVKSPSKEFIL